LSKQALFRTNYILVLAAGVTLILSACGSTADGTPAAHQGGVEFQLLDDGTLPARRNQDRPQGRVLCGKSAVRTVFRSWNLQAAIPATTSVDFNSSCVIAVLAGSRPSSGYRLRIAGIHLRDDQAIVSIAIHRLPGAIDAMSISRPYAVAEVTREAVANATPEALVRAASSPG
jgi:PrcB C-terminal